MITREIAKRNLAANVRRLLDRDTISMRELARRTGDSVVTISDVCREKTMPAGDVLARIADVFDVSIDRLLAEPPKNLANAS